MSMLVTDQKYQILQQKIKTYLLRKLQQKELSPEDLAAILYILAQTNTADELENFCSLFADSFSVLKAISEEFSLQKKISFEQRVQSVISTLVSKDPILAAKVAKAAQMSGMTWEKLVEQFPQINN